MLWGGIFGQWGSPSVDVEQEKACFSHSQGMGWVQLVRNGWAWGNLGRLNAALGMRFTEDEEAKSSLHNSHSCGVATLPGYPGSQAACPVLPGSCCCHPPQQVGPQESRKASASGKQKP